MDSAGGRPKDIRARRFAGEINPSVNEQIRRHLVAFKVPIYRAVYNCKEACCRDLEAEAAEEEEDRARDRTRKKGKGKASEDEESEAAISDTASVDSEPPKCVRPSNATRSCTVMLHVSLGRQLKIFTY